MIKNLQCSLTFILNMREMNASKIHMLREGTKRKTLIRYIKKATKKKIHSVKHWSRHENTPQICISQSTSKHIPFSFFS